VNVLQAGRAGRHIYLDKHIIFIFIYLQELSLLSPRLSQENVRLVGIGLEELGVEEFVEKKFWDGGNSKLVSITIRINEF
jgi:hypothetical protein